MSEESSGLPLGGEKQEASSCKQEMVTLPKVSRKQGAKVNAQGLTDKQIRFATAFLRGENITKSAIYAGYSPTSAAAEGSRLLKNDKVAVFIESERRRIADAAATQTLTDAKWVRQRLLEESKYYGKDATQAARIRAIELIAKLNGDFEADNKQKAGIFDGIPAEALDFVRERLRSRGEGDGADRPSGSFTH